MKTYIVGAGDFAREVYDTCKALGLIIESFIDENYENNSYIYNGIKNISDEMAFIENTPICNIIIGVGNPKIRKKIAEKYNRFLFPSLIHPRALITGIENYIGHGVIIQPGVILTNRILIDDFSVLNLNVTIGHDSNISKYVNISPGSNINGHTKIGDCTNIGSNVSTVPGTVVGSNCIVGAGTVLRNIYQSDVMIAGVPGKIIKNL